MRKETKLKTGIIGSVVAAICCFTPFLVVVLGAVGQSAWLGWLDYVLFPMLFASMGLVAHALYLRAGEPGPNPGGLTVVIAVVLSALLFWLEFRYALRISIAAAVALALYGFYVRRARVRAATNRNGME